MTLRVKFNRLTIFLGASTLVLASTAIHYARTLHREQARSAELAATIPVPALQVLDESRPTLVPAAVAHAAGGGEPSAELSDREFEILDTAEEIAVARHRLARLADPKRRREKAATLSDMIRPSLDDMAPHVGLSRHEIDRVMEATIDASIQGEQRLLECRTDSTCDPRKLEVPVETILEEQVARILGPEKQARFDAYNEAADERFYVQILRDRLTSGPTLTTEKAESLVMALADVRMQFASKAAQAGEKVEEINGGSMLNGGLRSAAIPGAYDEQARRVTSATEYSKRLVERAADTLGGELLAQFKASQEAALESYKRSLREQEVVAAARRAAGLR